MYYNGSSIDRPGEFILTPNKVDLSIYNPDYANHDVPNDKNLNVVPQKNQLTFPQTQNVSENELKNETGGLTSPDLSKNQGRHYSNTERVRNSDGQKLFEWWMVRFPSTIPKPN